jgi:hypothetical protein
MGKSLMPDPERAPLVRRACEEYATGRCTNEQLLKFEPLISEDLYSRVHAVLSGRVPMQCRSPKVPLREGAAGAGLQVALELECALFVGQLDDDVELPGTVARGVRASAGVVVGEPRGGVVREADVVMGFGFGTLQHVDESLVLGHPKAKATAVPKRWNGERAETMNSATAIAVSAIRVAVIACRIRTGLACRPEQRA